MITIKIRIKFLFESWNYGDTGPVPSRSFLLWFHRLHIHIFNQLWNRFIHTFLIVRHIHQRVWWKSCFSQKTIRYFSFKERFPSINYWFAWWNSRRIGIQSLCAWGWQNLTCWSKRVINIFFITDCHLNCRREKCWWNLQSSLELSGSWAKSFKRWIFLQSHCTILFFFVAASSSKSEDSGLCNMRLFGIGGVFDLSVSLAPSSLNEVLDDVLPQQHKVEFH